MNRREVMKLFGGLIIACRLPSDTETYLGPAALPEDLMPTRLEPADVALTGLELVRLSALHPTATRSALYELTLTRIARTNDVRSSGPYLDRAVFHHEGLLCSWRCNVLVPFDWLPAPEQRVQGMLSVYCSNPDVNWMAMFRHDRGLKVLAGGPGT